ncbi:MAG: extracellular solute-binding protein [Termitinemataceae bacterium]|nr:MAG: extracellular solute-binding protein [Termitinemataceae bacterium]
MNKKVYCKNVGFGVLFAALIALLLFSGCQRKKDLSNGTEIEDTLNICIDPSYLSAEIVEPFEKEFNIHVNYDEVVTPDEMFAKIQSGVSGYDLIAPACEQVREMIESNLLRKLDHAKIPNITYINPRALEKATYDPNMEYAVPLGWGAAGVAVNTAKVPVFEKSWSIFSRKDLAGRMTMLDDYHDPLSDALMYLGYSANSRIPEQIEEAGELVNTQWKPNLVRFDAETYTKGYATGDFWVVEGYLDAIYAEIANDPQLLKNTVMFLPKEGGLAFMDSFSILSEAKHPNAAHAFINYMCRPEVYAKYLDWVSAPPATNTEAGKFMKNTPTYSVEELEAETTQLRLDLGEARTLYTDIWFNKIHDGK